MGRRAFIVVAAIALACACNGKSKSKHPPIKERTAAGNRVTIEHPPADAGVAKKRPPTPPPAQPARFRCKTDADCVISCERPRSCCPQRCQCTIAYHKQQLARIHAENKRRCASASTRCPDGKCPASAVKVVAACSAGRCIAVDLPRGSKVSNGFLMLPGSPPPQACSRASDCVGDTLPAANGCCQDPRRIVPHSRAYKRFIHHWRTSKQQSLAGPGAVPCKGVTCPIAPPPSRPKRCLFEMQCKNKRCANTCTR